MVSLGVDPSGEIFDAVWAEKLSSSSIWPWFYPHYSNVLTKEEPQLDSWYEIIITLGSGYFLVMGSLYS